MSILYPASLYYTVIIQNKNPEAMQNPEFWCYLPYCTYEGRPIGTGYYVLEILSTGIKTKRMLWLLRKYSEHKH